MVAYRQIDQFYIKIPALLYYITLLHYRLALIISSVKYSPNIAFLYAFALVMTVHFIRQDIKLFNRRLRLRAWYEAAIKH